MKLTLTAAAALIGLAAVFGQAGAAPAASLPDETQVIQAGGRSSGGHRSGHRRGVAAGAVLGTAAAGAVLGTAAAGKVSGTVAVDTAVGTAADTAGDMVAIAEATAMATTITRLMFTAALRWAPICSWMRSTATERGHR
jgi:hypothetical protein